MGFSTRPYRLQHTLQLVILLIVTATAIAHPICLPEASLQALHDSIANADLFRHLLPWVSCGYSPLVLKESALITLALFGFFVFAWIKIRGQWLGEETSAVGGSGSWRAIALRPEVWLGIFVLYGAVSVLWSPTFQQSLRTWVLLCVGAGLAMVIRSVPVSRGFAVKFMLLTVCCGVVLAAIALLQHLGVAEWMPQSDDPRNRMSSLIGHNTGLSSWLMFPLSYCLYFGLTNRRLWARGVAWVSAALFILVIIAAESRAIWALALLLCVLLPWKLMRIHGRKLSMPKALAGVAGLLTIVLALMVSPQRNPLARLPVSLEERVTGHVLNLDQLRRETRLRILVVSMAELFPAAPIHGHGLGSFQWVYPKAQGAYFQAHPETRLGTTTKRTDLAHNDYLQILVELGMIGFALLLGCLLTAALDVRRRLIRLPSRFDRAVCWALAAPSGAVALHAIVDFPMHVAPIAVVAVFSLQLSRGLALAPGQLSVHQRFLSGFNIDEHNVAAEDGAPRTSGRRATIIGFTIACVIFSWVPWGWHAMVGRELISNAYLNTGRHWLQMFYQAKGQMLQQRFALLDRSRRAFRQAVVTNVFNGEAYEGQATACMNRASLALQVYLHDADDRETTQSRVMRSIIERDSATAVTIIRNQMESGGLRYHFTWYLLGRAFRMQWELERIDTQIRPEDSEAYGQAVGALRQAVAYNPADAVALRELSELLSQSNDTAEEAERLLGRLFKIDPYSAHELIIAPALELAAEGEIPTAQTMLDGVFAEHGDEPAVSAARAWLGFYQAVWPPAALDDLDREDEYLQWRREHLAAGRDAISMLPSDEDYGPEKQRLELLYAAAAAEHTHANVIAKKILEVDPQNIEARVILNWTNQELYGGGMPAIDSVEYFRTSAVFAVYFMSRREQGLVWAGHVYGRGGKLTLAQARRIAAFCVANERWDVLRKTLPAVRDDYPADEMLAEIARQTRVHLRDAATTSPL